jgi:hypothetical protein
MCSDTRTDSPTWWTDHSEVCSPWTVEKIGLSEAIAALRQELQDSMASANPDLRFKLGEVVLELELTLERSTTGKGGLKFWVLDAGAERARSKASTHRVTVPLTPLTKDDGPVYTGDKIIPGD